MEHFAERGEGRRHTTTRVLRNEMSTAACDML